MSKHRWTDGSVVILTALDLEYRAVQERLTGIRPHQHPAGTRFEVGTLANGAGTVALAQVGMGNHAAAVLAERAIAEFSPVAVLFVGVAGALRAGLALGDIVVATHVYAYHGAAARDDGMKSRPRVWDLDHRIDQTARHLARTGAWARNLPLEQGRPRVHFGPVASGEVLHDTRVSEPLRWIREHYDDALAIEMEAAGVAKAGQLNAAPIAVVRAISDLADGTKAGTDGKYWQPRAARHAAEFAAALAGELAGQWDGSSRGESEMTGHSNNAYGHSRVHVQADSITGGVWFAAEPGAGGGLGLAERLDEIGQGLKREFAAGRLDEATYSAAETELAAVAGRRDTVAVKRLRGLVADLPDLLEQVKVVGGML
jgi:adenosylhomocysteine nucleosidase